MLNPESETAYIFSPYLMVNIGQLLHNMKGGNKQITVVNQVCIAVLQYSVGMRLRV